MTESLLPINPNTLRTEGGGEEVRMNPNSQSLSFVPKRSYRRVPLFISREEAYYWTREWQHDEAEALKELERGEGRVFHDPKEAAQWLRSPED